MLTHYSEGETTLGREGKGTDELLSRHRRYRHTDQTKAYTSIHSRSPITKTE